MDSHDGPKTLQEFYNSQKLGDIAEKVIPFSKEEAEELSKESYIPADEIEKIGGVVVLNGVGEGFRPVNEAAAHAMEEYGAIGKDFGIKGKSASEGPIRGLIPANPSFSKLGSQDNTEAIHKYNQINEEALSKTDLYGTFIPKNKDGQEYYGFVNPENNLPLKDSEDKIIFAHKQADKFINEKDGSIIDTKGFKEQMVEAIGYVRQDENGNRVVKPATADADQLTQGIIDQGKYEEIDQEVAKNIGNTSAQGAALSQTLISETKEKGTVRHADESGNPFPEDFANGQPHLFVVPKAIRNEQGIITGVKAQGIICNSEQEILDKIYNKPELKELNFKANPLWGWQRNEKGDLEIDPNRTNAQSIYLRTSLIKEEHNEQKYNDANEVTESLRELGEVKLADNDIEYKRSSIYEAESKFREKHTSFVNHYQEDILSKGTKFEETKCIDFDEPSFLDNILNAKQNELDTNTLYNQEHSDIINKPNVELDNTAKKENSKVNNSQSQDSPSMSTDSSHKSDSADLSVTGTAIKLTPKNSKNFSNDASHNVQDSASHNNSPSQTMANNESFLDKMGLSGEQKSEIMKAAEGLKGFVLQGSKAELHPRSHVQNEQSKPKLKGTENAR